MQFDAVYFADTNIKPMLKNPQTGIYGIFPSISALSSFLSVVYTYIP
jgi:hypothetical protein